MVEIDADAKVDIIWQGEDVTVRIPLASEAPPGWCDRYRALASRKGVPAGAEEHPSRAWVIVTVPAWTALDEIVATLDAARELVGETGATEKPPDPARTQAAIMQWWAGLQQAGSGGDEAGN